MSTTKKTTRPTTATVAAAPAVQGLDGDALRHAVDRLAEDLFNAQAMLEAVAARIQLSVNDGELADEVGDMTLRLLTVATRRVAGAAEELIVIDMRMLARRAAGAVAVNHSGGNSHG
jgi:hypothetical protein